MAYFVEKINGRIPLETRAEASAFRRKGRSRKMKGRGGKRPVNARERQGKKMFLMILPFLILCFLFSYFPLHGWIYAFYDYKAPLKLSQCFVGFNVRMFSVMRHRWHSCGRL